MQKSKNKYRIKTALKKHIQMELMIISGQYFGGIVKRTLRNCSCFAQRTMSL